MSTTPYVEHPPLSVVLHRVSLFARYAAMSILGVILIASFGGWFTPVGVAMVSLNAVSAISVMLSKYRAEWVCLLPIIGINLAAIVLLIPISTGAILLLLIVASLVEFERFIHLSNVATTLRKLPSKH